MSYLKRFNFQKKYLVFFTIVPLLLVTALVRVDCPVCYGTGSLVNTPNMENVKITSVDSKGQDVRRDPCGFFLMYNYDVILSLTNEGSDAALGFVVLVLIDFTKGEALDAKYAVVEVLGQTTLDVTYNIWFESKLDEPVKTAVNAAVLLGEVPDQTCAGTGQVSLNVLPLVSRFKDGFQEKSRDERPFMLPVGPLWEEWKWENE